MRSDLFSVHEECCGTCRGKLERLRNDDFNVDDRERLGRPEELETNYLQVLLVKNSAQSTDELTKQLARSRQNNT